MAKHPRKNNQHTFKTQLEVRDRSIVERWIKAEQKGYATFLCDIIVRNHDLNTRLIKKINETEIPVNFDVKWPHHRPKTGRDGKLARKPNMHELQVIRCYADGLSLEDISKKLHLSKSAISARVQRAYDKTGAASLHHLVAIAIRADWIA